jgi:hypothetical protein
LIGVACWLQKSGTEPAGFKKAALKSALAAPKAHKSDDKNS